MVSWEIYEFLDRRGERVIESWLSSERIQTKAIALLEEKIGKLKTAGLDLPPNLLAHMGGSIYKLKVRADGVQLRPMLCRGPVNNDAEFTFLLGAVERGGKLDPSNAVALAEDNRRELIASPWRRREYEL